ncbi:hypothetical protein PHYBLDRAFT_73070 [Phycomyces blakesleeanus NRRL 1555(-)]|uniref:DDE Tnp4 domain-containing protein n=1 Tax=Phycomyces blakesleeanus (strain ATCC 8743b / DSM 1359 / FGSC 10004 / NBRC 33097 / NRRL 1555) TaxID=763407 RepID=A0A162U198_PHYB8|nr:hypothetical protein PHYBLDRAFT_73070 [Phycomyces blakesleeanus NRRL 1555(-)]OAD72662.1 hypothetical protein PHYBLDRAFT_73070 [Phycomyces blakesleeanus NRRL 1555(-)]|eukprot:XP_018290702.1 hypothetical protein PHYBLDRAFT_73070 [Phycomyces blakesleeanus NRRL 1555(-)]
MSSPDLRPISNVKIFHPKKSTITVFEIDAHYRPKIYQHRKYISIASILKEISCFLFLSRFGKSILADYTHLPWNVALENLGSNSFQLQYQMSRTNFELSLNIFSQYQIYEAALNNKSYPIEIQVATFLGVSAGSYTWFTMQFITVISDYSDMFVNWGVHDSETAARRVAEFEQPERRGICLPGVIETIAGKLISIQKPYLHRNSWVDCHNNSSMNLLAVCNANKCFIFVRTGQSDSAFPIIENILPLYSIATEDPKQQAFNKAYAKTCHYIENAFGLLMTLTIITHCALHNFCLDNNNIARNILEDTLRTFENQVRGFDAYINGGDDDDVEIEVEGLDSFMNEISVDLENAS